jgi:hypothetical protein
MSIIIHRMSSSIRSILFMREQYSTNHNKGVVFSLPYKEPVPNKLGTPLHLINQHIVWENPERGHVGVLLTKHCVYGTWVGNQRCTD